MELGVIMFGDIADAAKSGTSNAAHRRLQELLAEIKLADDVGLDIVGLGEHHREEYAVASPEIVLAAAASITRNVKLTSAVTVLSSADPVKVYQDFATLDLLSNGRAELMAGRGSFIESFPLFGYSVEDYERLFEEKLDLLLTIDANDPVTWSGSVRAPLVSQHLFPRPLNGGLPIWIATGGNGPSVVRSASLGLPMMLAIIGGNPIQFQPLAHGYRRVFVQAGHDLARARIGLSSHCFIGNDAATAADAYFPFYAAQMNRIGASRGWPPYTRETYDFGRSPSGALFVGSPAEIVDKILYQHELFGLSRFIANMDVGGPSHAMIMRSIELFGSKVLPEVRRAVAR